MQNGKWVPISKFFADSLPRDRKFTELEAMYSLQLDYDKSNSITVSGCASRWGWSRSKVSKFLSDNEIVIVYDKDTKSLKKQRGFIDIHQDKKRALKEHKDDNKETLKEHKRFIDSKWIADQKSNKKAKKEHKKSNNSSTTIDPNPNPKSKTLAPEPNDYKLSENLIKWATGKNINKNELLDYKESCLLWHGSKGSKYVNWDKTIQNWILKDYKMNGNKNKVDDDPLAEAKRLFGEQ